MPSFLGRSYAAFLFDMDGTMLDSTHVVERVWGAWATRHGIDVITVLAHVHGVRAEDTVRRFAPDGLDLASEVAWIQHAEMQDVEGIVSIPGITELIAGLDARQWAVVTSAPRALATLRMRAIGVPVPTVFITAEDVERGKPDPEGFLKAAAVLGVPIGECLVFEDSAAGVAAAQAAGAQVAIVGTAVAAKEGMLTITDYR